MRLLGPHGCRCSASQRENLSFVSQKQHLFGLRLPNRFSQPRLPPTLAQGLPH
jgi:hypothetical protein